MDVSTAALACYGLFSLCVGSSLGLLGAWASGRFRRGERWRAPLISLAACAVFIVAAAMGLIGGIVAAGDSGPSEASLDGPVTPVLVATRDLEAGRELAAEDLETLPLATTLVTDSHLSREELRWTKGRRLMLPVGAGEPLLRPMLQGDAPSGLCTWIREARRGR